MNSLRGVSIRESAVGANVAGDSREFGLLCCVQMTGAETAVPVLDGLYTFRRLSDAESVGITPAFDIATGGHLHRHISEFYRRTGGGGRILHVCVKDASVAGLQNEFVGYAKDLLIGSGGNISDIAVAYQNIGSNVFFDGLAIGVSRSIPVLQGIAEWADENDMPVHFILEGRDISRNLNALADLRNFQVEGNLLEAQKVTVVIGQDRHYAATRAEGSRGFADVGTFLGNVASQDWNRNPGEVATQNLTDVPRGNWLVGGLSNHKQYSEVYEALETLNEKGYVFPIRYQGTAGWFWNDGHTCTPIILDAAGNINQHAIYLSHTIDMSKRALRQAFMPEVKKPVELEEGKITQDMVDYFNALGDNAFGMLAGRSLISDGKTDVSPDSDLLIAKVLDVQFAVIPTGMVNEIIGVINLRSN